LPSFRPGAGGHFKFGNDYRILACKERVCKTSLNVAETYTNFPQTWIRIANHRWRGQVTPAKRGKGVKRIANTEVRSPADRHAAMTWAQRLKRVFSIDIEVCGRCGGSARVIACIEDQDVIDNILAHLRDKEQGTPTLPHLAPPTRAPPETLSLFDGKESEFTEFNQQGRH
jgi:hypothetical protein